MTDAPSIPFRRFDTQVVAQQNGWLVAVCPTGQPQYNMVMCQAPTGLMANAIRIALTDDIITDAVTHMTQPALDQAAQLKTLRAAFGIVGAVEPPVETEPAGKIDPAAASA